MALHRRKIKSYVTCGICKDAYTMYTVHGGFKLGKAEGAHCCSHCYHVLKVREKNLSRKKEMA